jgi:hypothetical protein
MRNFCSRLLLLLVLVSVVAAAGWSTGHADGVKGTPTFISASLSGMKPGAAPASGEPDVGQTPHSATKGAMSHVPQGWNGGEREGPDHSRFRWIFRMWMARYLGAR